LSLHGAVGQQAFRFTFQHSQEKRNGFFCQWGDITTNMVIYENYSVSTTEFVEKNLLYEKAMKPVYNNKALGVKFTENFSEV